MIKCFSIAFSKTTAETTRCESTHRWTPAVVCRFKAEFPRLNESTVREFQKKYNIEIANAAKEKKEVSKLIPKN